MSERLETLKKARERMADDRDAFAKTLAAPFDRDKAERARVKFIETQMLIDAIDRAIKGEQAGPAAATWTRLRLDENFEAAADRKEPIGRLNWTTAVAQMGIARTTSWIRRTTMNNSTLSLAELDDRIAILRDNLRQLVEQAAAASGGQSEERIADRIAQQTDELDKLVLERDSRTKK
jgi:hypothetical protein